MNRPSPIRPQPPRSAESRPPTTQVAILDAAEELFAAQGFAATSIKQIGQRADANTALLYYYYGDKVGLYRAVLDRLVDALSASALPRLTLAQSAEDVIRAIVRAQVELMTRHPRAAALIIREMIDHQAEHAQPMILKLASELFRPATTVIERGKGEGKVRSEIDSALAAVSTISQLVYFVVAQPMIRQLLGLSGTSPSAEDLRAFGRHAEAFALAAITTDGKSRGHVRRSRQRKPRERR